MNAIDKAKPERVDPSKRYRYTWPGCSAKEVSGEELNAILKGCDATQLAIEEVASKQEQKK